MSSQSPDGYFFFCLPGGSPGIHTRHWPAGGLDPATLLADPHARLHLYGKGTPRAGRKMGHVTVSAATVSEAERHVRAIRDRLTVGLPDDAAHSAG